MGVSRVLHLETGSRLLVKYQQTSWVVSVHDGTRTADYRGATKGQTTESTAGAACIFIYTPYIYIYTWPRLRPLHDAADLLAICSGAASFNISSPAKAKKTQKNTGRRRAAGGFRS